MEDKVIVNDSLVHDSLRKESIKAL